MSLLPVCRPGLLILLHLVAGGVLGDTTVSSMTVSVNVTSGSLLWSTEASDSPLEMTTSTAKGPAVPAVKPKVIVYCLEDGRRMLLCDPGPHSKGSVHWMIDGKDLEKSQASVEHHGHSVILGKDMSGELVCKFQGQAEAIDSSSIKSACEGETWFLYSIIVAGAGGIALLLAIIVSIVTCCCGRKSRHVHLGQDEIELASVGVDPAKNPNGQEVRATEETQLMPGKTAPNMAPEADESLFVGPQEMEHLAPEEDGRCTRENRESIPTSEADGFQFPSPPDMENLAPGSDGGCIAKDRLNVTAAGSDGSGIPEDQDMEKGSSGVEGN